MESRTQGSRPRTKKNTRPRTALPRTDSLEAQGQECSRRWPRTQAQVFSKKKNGLQKFFSGDLQERKTKKLFAKFSARFLAFSNKILTVQKIVRSSSRGLGNLRGLEVLRPRPRTSKCVPEAKGVLEDFISGKLPKVMILMKEQEAVAQPEVAKVAFAPR